MSREYFSSNPAAPFSDAVLVDGKTLYLSGRIGLIPGTTKVPDTPEEEAHLVMQEIQRVLAMAAMTIGEPGFSADLRKRRLSVRAVQCGVPDLLYRQASGEGVSWVGNAALQCAI